MAGTEAPDQAGVVVVVGCARSSSNGQRERVSHHKLVVRPRPVGIQSTLLGGSSHLNRIMCRSLRCVCHPTCDNFQRQGTYPFSFKSSRYARIHPPVVYKVQLTSPIQMHTVSKFSNSFALYLNAIYSCLPADQIDEKLPVEYTTPG